MKYPPNLKTKKTKAAYWFFFQYYTFQQGRGAVIGKVSNIITEIGLIGLILNQFTPIKLNWQSLSLLVILMIIVCWLIGRFYMRNSLDKIEAQVSNERNPMMNDIHINTVKKREELK